MAAVREEVDEAAGEGVGKTQREDGFLGER